MYTRSLVALSAIILVTACGGSGSSEESIDSVKSAHLVQCDGLTPGFWCGGASTATDSQCQAVGGIGATFSSCEEMCECFGAADAAKDVDTTSCPANCEDGMADVLQKFFAAFQLSFPTATAFACDASWCGDGFCYLWEVEDALGLYADCASRDEQEAIKNCIDTILNTGGVCVGP